MSAFRRVSACRIVLAGEPTFRRHLPTDRVDGGTTGPGVRAWSRPSHAAPRERPANGELSVSFDFDDTAIYGAAHRSNCRTSGGIDSAVSSDTMTTIAWPL